VSVGTGFASAARNSDRLPSQGDFKLVELLLENTDQGRRLVGIHCYALARHWALPALARGDDAIVGKLTGPAGLSRDQKDLVRQVLRDRFMPDVWRDAQAVLDYLASADYHSPGSLGPLDRAPAARACRENPYPTDSHLCPSGSLLAVPWKRKAHSGKITWESLRSGLACPADCAYSRSHIVVCATSNRLRVVCHPPRGCPWAGPRL